MSGEAYPELGRSQLARPLCPGFVPGLRLPVLKADVCLVSTVLISLATNIYILDSKWLTWLEHRVTDAS